MDNYCFYTECISIYILGIELTQVFSPVWGDGLYQTVFISDYRINLCHAFCDQIHFYQSFYVFKDGGKSSKTVERDLDLNIWRCKGNSQFGYDFYFAIFNQ